MKRSWKRFAVGIGLLGLLGGIGGGLVFAQSQNQAGPNPVYENFVGQLANKLGVNTGTLKQDIQEVASSMLNQAVKDGKIPASRAQEIEKALAAGKLPFNFGHGHRFQRRGGSMFGLVAKTVGISRQELIKELKTGKTMVEIAQAHGVSQTTLETAVVNQMTAKLNKAVAAGRVSSQQKAQILSQMQTRLQNLLTTPMTKWRPSSGSWHHKAGSTGTNTGATSGSNTGA